LDHLDVLIVGAGISGISGAYHLTRNCPGKRIAIFEGRDTLGGTWDLFRYPGIRSDSDMYTLGFSFKPWTSNKAIADAPSIMSYLNETVDEFDLRRLIAYRHRVTHAAWDSAAARWQVTYHVGEDAQPRHVTCGFLYMCSGYYNYAQGHRPEFAGESDFGGQIIHPQFWPEGLDYHDKKVVVIGSGATAVTIVPAMTTGQGGARHVTMLQRSPTYVVSAPGEDSLANWLRSVMPGKLTYGLIRWRNVLRQMFFYMLARARPQAVKKKILEQLAKELPQDFDIATHFTPRYNPWDQRICLVPDSDLFLAIKAGKADVVTDHIDHFVRDGITLASGKTLPADIVVTATGLELQLLSGLEVTVDGRAVNFAETFSYKGMMYSGVPNLASCFGYTNASWTLKADLTAEYVCRLLQHMDATRTKTCCPALHGSKPTPAPWLSFTSGYVTRAMERFPKQGEVAPWKVHQNYALDLLAFRFGKLDDGTMEFA
jgi:cation diffusion facilitator CzcD-associated flavoprotein CzcO